MQFCYKGRNIHYDSLGEGRPLLLLNGIMMTTASWAPFLEAFRRSGHRLLLLDLMDQGRSDAFDEDYTLATQADMVLEMLDALKIDKVSLLGTSYGGALALQIACAAPERMERLLLSATRCYTDPLFRDMCEGWLHATQSPQAFYTATIPLFYGATFQQRQAAWMQSRRRLLEGTAFKSPDFLARMRRLIRSIMRFDLRAELGRISCPTLVLSAAEDLVMMPWEQKRIADGIPNAELVTMEKTGHVMFLERPELFTALCMGWMDYRDSIPLP